VSWALFIDESGQDQRQSPYEVLAGIAIEDRKLWRLIRDLSDAQEEIFGLRLFEAYGSEAKAQKLLKKKVFTHAAQMSAFPPDQRRTLAREILQDGTAVSRKRLTALAQAKLAYVGRALSYLSQGQGAGFRIHCSPGRAPPCRWDVTQGLCLPVRAIFLLFEQPARRSDGIRCLR